MKAVVIGGAGFIGSHVVDALVAAGHDVIAIDRALHSVPATSTDVRFVRSEIGNRGEVAEVLSTGVDVVIHLVSSTTPGSSNDDPVFDIQTNLVDTIQLLSLYVEHKVGKIVFGSSGGTIYGISDAEFISEDHQTDPICSYGITKLAVEKYLRMYQHLHGLKHAALRVSNPYGPRQSPHARQGLIAVMTYRVLMGQPVDIWGDGGTVRDYVDVHDVARAFVAASTGNATGAINIGSGRGLSILQVLDVVQQSTGRKAEIRWLPPRPFDVPRVILDCRRARDVLGWEAHGDLATGLARVRDWISRTYA